MNFLFLLGGLLLGWSLGANNTADLFGTAIGSKMLKLKTALITAAIFVILGAVLQGEYTTKNIGELGKINAIGGAFTVCLGTALTVIWMTKAGFLVSITQALVGGIIGWTLFVGDFINTSGLYQIFGAWIMAPILGFAVSFLLFKIIHREILKTPINLFTFDFILRISFIVVGAMASFSFGANNIANIVGVYVFSKPFNDVWLWKIKVSGLYILLFVGSLAIALGILTGSERVIKTVGEKILKISPLAGIVVVLTQSIVLFLFSSSWLKNLLEALHLKSFPLVPVSSSQVVIGAMIGIGFARGSGRLINFGVLKDIVLAWIITPLASCVLSFILLFFAQNVFQITVKYPIRYAFDAQAVSRIREMGIPSDLILPLKGRTFPNGRSLKMELKSKKTFKDSEINTILEITRVDSIVIDSGKIKQLPKHWFKQEEMEEIKKLHGKVFVHLWQLKEELAKTEAFKGYLDDPARSKEFDSKIKLLLYLFRKNYR